MAEKFFTCYSNSSNAICIRYAVDISFHSHLPLKKKRERKKREEENPIAFMQKKKKTKKEKPKDDVI